MPHTLHQALVWAFADDPELAFDLVREVFGVRLPPLTRITDRHGALDCFAPCFGDTRELRPDLALSGDVTDDPHGRGVAMIIEIQRHVETRKRWRLWVYWALLAEKLGRSTGVMLVALDDGVGRWARRLGAREIPPRECLLVLDRQNMPRVTDIEEARRCPAKGLVSAVLHARSDDIEVIMTALTVALELPDDRRWRYASSILSAVSDERKARLLEQLTMEERHELTDLERNSIAFHDGRREGKLEGKREGKLEGKREGKLEGLVRLVLTIIELRSLPLDPHTEQRIRSCTDPDALERWAVRARRIASVTELFDG